MPSVAGRLSLIASIAASTLLAACASYAPRPLAALALGLSRGSGLQKPLATAIIFGLAIGAPLVLTMLPTLVLVFGRIGRPGEDASPGSILKV
jgi:Cu/Ag efflux pump CusA